MLSRQGILAYTRPLSASKKPHPNINNNNKKKNRAVELLLGLQFFASSSSKNG
jgi:hypothetical protein